MKVRLFGGIRLQLNGLHVDNFRTRKVALLFAYLITHRRHPLSRVELADLLFPEQGETQARANLRNTLFYLKEVLEKTEADSPYLMISSQSVGFNSQSEYWLDVADFDDLIEKAAQQAGQRAYELQLQAVKLYRGDFLAGYYEDWSVQEQERLRSLYQEQLQALAEHEEESGRVAQAIKHAQQLVTLNPLKETEHCRLMRLFIQQGEMEKARSQYHLCERLLYAELGVSPDQETQALFARIKAKPKRVRDPRSGAQKELERGRRALEHGLAQAAKRSLQAVLQQLRRLHDPAEAEVHYHLGRIALQDGQLETAQCRLAKARCLAQQAQDSMREALALNALGAAASAAGNLEAAKEHYHAALQIAEHGLLPQAQWRALNNLGRNAWLRGLYDEALRHYSRAQLLCGQLCDRKGTMIVLQNQGTLLSHLGHFDEAHRCYQEACRLAEEAENPAWFKTLWQNWADVYERQGCYERAAQCYRRAYKVNWAHNEALCCAAALCGLGCSLIPQAEVRPATRYLTRALQQFQSLKAHAMSIHAMSALALAQLKQGNTDGALQLSAKAVELLESGVASDEPQRVYLTHAQILKQNGDCKRARCALGKTWKLVEQRARQLARQEDRRSYLENVPLHRLIMSMWECHGTMTTGGCEHAQQSASSVDHWNSYESLTSY